MRRPSEWKASRAGDDRIAAQLLDPIQEGLQVHDLDVEDHPVRALSLKLGSSQAACERALPVDTVRRL